MQAIKRIQQTPISQFPAFFLLTGEEELLMKRYLSVLIDKVVSKGMHDLNLLTYEGKDFTIEGLLESFETLPVLADKKMVVIKNPSFLETKGVTITDKEERQLLQYFKEPSLGTCVVFYCLKKPDGRKKVFKAIKKSARIEDFPRLKEPELRHFIHDEIEKAGKTIDASGLKKFAESFDYTGNNANQSLLDVHHEVQKLMAYMGQEKHITLKQVDETTYAAFQNDIFMLIDSFAHKRGAETQVRLHELLSNGEPLMKIIGYLRNQFKLMLRVKELSSQGYTASKLATKLKQHPYAMKKTMGYSQQFDEMDLMRLLNGFLALDRQMKQGKLDAQTALELLIADVCTH